MSGTNSKTLTIGLMPVAVLLLLLIVPSSAAAQDTTASVSSSISTEHEMGIATMVGPTIGASGPPTAVMMQVQFWHNMIGDFAFHASAGMTVSGDTTFRSDDPEMSDAQYDSTVGGSFGVGVRWLMSFLDWPVDTYLRGALEVGITGGEELIGYSFAPTVAGGLSYPLMDGLSLVGEVEVGTGFGQYRGSGGEFALTFDVLAGAQLEF